MKFLLLDFDGVLRDWPQRQKPCGAGSTISDAQVARVAFADELLEPAIRGTITDEQWRSRVAARLSEDHDEADARAATADWSVSCGVLSTTLLQLIKRRRPDVGIGLATNATTRLVSDLAALGLTGFFDLVINSSDIGFIKPEREYFHHALAATNTEASDTVFIDDTAANVAVAAKLGFVTHHYVGVDTLEAFMSRTDLLGEAQGDVQAQDHAIHRST